MSGTLEIAIYAGMTGDGGIAGIVSDRIYPGRVPLNASLPAIGYERITTATDLTHDGDSDFETVRIQFSGVGNTVAETKSVIDAIAAYWNGKKATVNGSVKVDGSRIANRRDGDQDPEPSAFVEYLDVLIPHSFV